MNRISTKTALLAGATGLVGHHCLNLLLANSQYSKVITLTRWPLETETDKHENKVIDFEELDRYQDDMKVDDVFCCLGTTRQEAGSKAAFRKVDYTFVTELGELAVQNGATQFFVVTAIGADAYSPFLYNKVKGETEDELISQDWPSLHIFRPSVLLGQRSETRVLEEAAKNVMKWMSFVLQGRLRKFRAIDAKHVAAAMLSVANEQRKGVNIYESDVITKYGRQFLAREKGPSSTS